MRKGLFVATDGHLRSCRGQGELEEGRTAKALERQNRLLQNQGRSGGLLGGLAQTKASRAAPAQLSPAAVVEELAEGE
jgi:hypothetical protein